MDKFLDQLPFFTPEHRALAADMESFVQLEIESRAIEERDIDARLREYVAVLAKAGDVFTQTSIYVTLLNGT